MTPGRYKRRRQDANDPAMEILSRRDSPLGPGALSSADCDGRRNIHDAGLPLGDVGRTIRLATGVVYIRPSAYITGD